MNGETVRTITVAGLTCHYRRIVNSRQDGPATEPVLLLGGALQHKDGWGTFDEGVGAVADLITVDMPGAGASDQLRPGQGMDVMCQVVEAVLDDAGIGRVNLFGYSFGSVIAFTFARRHPHRVSRLMLGGTPANLTEAECTEWRTAAERGAAGHEQEFVDFTMGFWLCQDESRVIRNRRLAHRYVRRIVHHAVTLLPYGLAVLNRSSDEWLDTSGGLVGVPTLVFCGEHDTVSDARRQREFAATIEDSTFVTIAEADHWATLERPAECVDLVVRFFTDQPLQDVDYLATCAPALV